MTAVDGLSLRIEPGEVVAFLGPGHGWLLGNPENYAFIAIEADCYAR